MPNPRPSPADRAASDDRTSVEPTRPQSITRLSHGRTTVALDHVSVEEPLEIRVGGDPFAVVMRTPGDDTALAVGFLLSERVLHTYADVASLAPVSDRRGGLLHNVIDVTLTESAQKRQRPHERRVTTSAACGLCGRQTIESLAVDAPRATSAWAVDASVLLTLPERLRVRQAAFDRTGGLHAAAALTPDGDLVCHAEDVGRHNAVDKVIGRFAAQGALPLSNFGLFVSGRTSYEIVQKAFLAGMPLVAAVSAPSSLAVDLAERAGITLIGFVRGTRLNVYTHPHRVRTGAEPSGPL